MMKGNFEGNEKPKQNKVELTPEEIERVEAEKLATRIADEALFNPASKNRGERFAVSDPYLKNLQERQEFKNLTGNEAAHLPEYVYGELYTAQNFTEIDKMFGKERQKEAQGLLARAEELERRAQVTSSYEEEVDKLKESIAALETEIESKKKQISALERQDGYELSEAYNDARFMRGVYERQKTFTENALREIEAKTGDEDSSTLKKLAGEYREEAEKLLQFLDPRLN
jgi:uncharacterized small protein (DUF1192 family)